MAQDFDKGEFNLLFKDGVEENDEETAILIAGYPASERISLVNSAHVGNKNAGSIAGELAGDGWVAWPGRDYLRASLGLRPVQLHRGLTSLVKAGLLVNLGEGYIFFGPTLLRLYKQRAERREFYRPAIESALSEGDVNRYRFLVIMANTGLSETQMIKAMKNLNKHGLLGVDESGGIGMVMTDRVVETLAERQARLDGKAPLP